MTTLEHFLSNQVNKNRTPGLQYYFFNRDDILYSYCGGLIGTGRGFVSYLQELLKPDNRLISDEYRNQLFNENITLTSSPP